VVFLLSLASEEVLAALFVISNSGKSATKGYCMKRVVSFSFFSSNTFDQSGFLAADFYVNDCWGFD
jgi:hypothetical protein